MLRFFIKGILFCGFCFASSAWTTTLPFEDARPLYAGARPLAMGNAFTALADDAEAGFWNPAGLVQWQGVKIGGVTKIWNREDYAFDPKCVAYCYRDIGFFWGNKIAIRVDSGNTPDFTYYSFARRLSPHLALGGSVKFRRKHPSDYYQFFGYDPGYDLGVLWRPNAKSSVGMLVQNMGDDGHLISVAVLGYVHRFSRRMLLSADLATLFGRPAALEPRFGGEWQPADWFALRAGVSDGHPTAGAGLKLWMLRVDYAWIRNQKGNAHFLSGQIKF